ALVPPVGSAAAPVGAPLALAPGRGAVPATRRPRVTALQGRVDGALAEIDPGVAQHGSVDSLHASRLYLMQYAPGLTMPAIAQAHADWGARYPDRPAPAVAAPAPKIRIGYVSPDFRAHPVGFFLEPVLANHDRSAFEVVCYANTANPDWKTERLMAHADHWVWTTGLDDAALAQRIQADGIHILVDLAGQTFGNRLPVFARAPGPGPAAWAGYVGPPGRPATATWISRSR
ncbi:hypothetical protein GAY28_38110, partial [Azospirillum brasilense]|nr:hypothetical protein [Azospirillum brasilense]